MTGARARVGWQAREGFWQEPLVVRAGRAIAPTAHLASLGLPRDSYTVFIHLIDGAGRPVAVTITPPWAGPAPPTCGSPSGCLGQTFTDPYRLILPSDLPPGDYWLEVGMYGMTSLRRLPVVDLAGNLAGDRVILGPGAGGVTVGGRNVWMLHF